MKEIGTKEDHWVIDVINTGFVVSKEMVMQMGSRDSLKSLRKTEMIGIANRFEFLCELGLLLF